MTLPFFFVKDINRTTGQLLLDEETSRHAIQVLRMQAGERLHLTDGQGALLTAVIADAHKKRCSVTIESVTTVPARTTNVTIAIALLKNTTRFEWFLEKATEIGVGEIVPLITAHTERMQFRYARMQTVLVSAMLQSQQCWLPRLQEPVKVDELIKNAGQSLKLIAHCEEEKKQSLLSLSPADSALILIGPEGDFSKEEIALALNNRFVPVTLGNTRLRSETAGVVAATLLCIR